MRTYDINKVKNYLATAPTPFNMKLQYELHTTKVIVKISKTEWMIASGLAGPVQLHEEESKLGKIMYWLHSEGGVPAYLKEV